MKANHTSSEWEEIRTQYGSVNGKRLEVFKTSEFTDIIAEWPVLKGKYAPLLVNNTTLPGWLYFNNTELHYTLFKLDIDFSVKFPGKTDEFFAAWEKFVSECQHLYTNIKDVLCKNLISQQNDGNEGR